MVAAQRAKQLETLNTQKDRKLKEQDAIIQAQFKKINQLELDLGAKSSLVAEYESRFMQVKEAVADDKERTQQFIQTL